jgi:transglutaminase-like putative cysteine protease
MQSKNAAVMGALLAAAAMGGFLENSRAQSRSSTFEVRHQLKATLPKTARQVRVWFVLPQDDPVQQVRNLKIEAPYPYRVEKDSEGNNLLYLETAKPAAQDLTVLMTFTLTRQELRSGADPSRTHPLSDQERLSMKRYLAPNQYIPIDPTMRELAEQVMGNETNPVRAARKTYDWIIANVDYYAKDPQRLKGTDEGNATYCLTAKTGNCGDMGSLWIALARAKGIPARMVYGSFFKPEFDGKDVDQDAHSWVEFYAPGLGWVPMDLALGDLYAADYTVNAENRIPIRRATADGTYGSQPQKVNFYFGNLEERRVTWSRGRDLTLTPRQNGGPINALFEAYIEVDGKPLPKGSGWNRKVTYRHSRD